MAIKIIKICDDCGKEYEQISTEILVDDNGKKYIDYPVDFICLSCILEKEKK